MGSSELSPQRSGVFDKLVNGILNRFFDWASLWPASVLFISILFAFASIWVVQDRLKFKTGRDDLVSQNLSYNKLYKDYRNAFDDYDGMIAVVEGPSPKIMAEFVEAFATRLTENPSLFSKFFYKVDTSYFKAKGLLYLENHELDDLVSKVLMRQDFLEDFNDNPGLNNFLAMVDRQISSGMVDSMLSGLVEDENIKEKKNDQSDLSLLSAVLEQTATHLKSEAPYNSPWYFISKKEDGSLKEKGYLVSNDNSMLFVLINPKETEGDFTGAKQSIEAIRSMIYELAPKFNGILVGLTGAEVVAADEMAATLRDVAFASQITLFGVALLFVIVFRSVVRPLLAVFCLVLALFWTLGYTTLTVGSLNILSVVFTTILIGLGIDFGIHLLERYREEMLKEHEPKLALRKTVIGTGKGNLAGAITTAIAFGALAAADFRGIAELGIISGGGIVLCFIAMTITLPACLTLVEKWRPSRERYFTAEKKESQFSVAFYSRYKLIVLVCSIMIVIASWPLKDFEFDYNILNLQAKGTEAVEYELKMMKKGNRSTWYAVSLVSTLEEARKRSEEFKKLSTVEKVESVASLFPDDQEIKLEKIKQLEPFVSKIEIESENESISIRNIKRTLKRILFKLQDRDNFNEDESTVKEIARSRIWAKAALTNLDETGIETSKRRLQSFSDTLLEDYRNKMNSLRRSVTSGPVVLDEFPEDFKRRYIGNDGRFLLTIYPSIDMWKRVEMESFLKELRSIDPLITGNGVHLYQSGQKMKEGYIQGGQNALCAIFVYLLFSFRRFWTAILVLIPTITGSFWTVGMMAILDIHFNLANLVILPLILGIGVVDGVHLVHRFREEADKTVCLLSKSVGKAVILTTLTTMIGFGSLMVADHRGIHSLGLLLTIGVANCLLASITLLPALLRWSAEKRISV